MKEEKWVVKIFIFITLSMKLFKGTTWAESMSVACLWVLLYVFILLIIEILKNKGE